MSKIHPEDKEKFEEQQICLICREVPQDIKACAKCSRLYCKECLMDWYKTNPVCPNKCSNDPMTIKDLSPENLMKDANIRFKCGNCCEEYFYHDEYVKHISISKLPLCSKGCGNKAPFIQNDKAFCSYKCYNELFYGGQVDPLRESLFPFYFDFPNNNSYKLNNDGSIDHVFNGQNTEEANFDTIINKIGFLNCYHKLEITTENAKWPYKVGYTRDNKIQKEDVAFSDFETGFAFYTIGQTRNESSMSGLPYGKQVDVTKPAKIISEFNILDGKMQFWDRENCFGSMFEGEWEADYIIGGTFYFAFAARTNMTGLRVKYI